MAQITLNSSGVASDGSLLLQSNGTTTAVTINTSQNVGVGATPSSWGSSDKAIDIGGGNQSSISANLAGAFATNAYFNGTDWKYKNSSGTPGLYSQSFDGQHKWFRTASGTAGNTISWTQAMTLSAAGELGIGTSSNLASSKLDVRGIIRCGSGNSTNDAEVVFSNYASATSAWNISVRQDVGGANNDLKFLRFNSSGTYQGVAMQIDSAGGRLLVAKNTTNDGDTGFMFEPIRDGAGNGRLTITQSSSTNSGVSYSAYSSGAAAYRFYVGMGGTVFATSTTISAISDIRFKENVRDLNVGLAEVMALKPRLYDWKEGKGQDIKNARGFIAQEFEEVFPDLIDEWKDPAPEGEDPYKSVRADLIPVLVKAIQELKAIVDAQAVEIAALKGTA